jgi:hypothetical protein
VVVSFVLLAALLLAGDGESSAGNDPGNSGQNGNENTPRTRGPTVGPDPTSPSVSASPPVPTLPVPIVNRQNCAEITGTAYRSDEERVWYQGNCVPQYQGTLTLDKGIGATYQAGEYVVFCYDLSPSSAFSYRQFASIEGGTSRQTFSTEASGKDCWTGQLELAEVGRKDFRAEFIVSGQVVATASAYIQVVPPTAGGRLTVDRGAGSQYKVGEFITFCYALSPKATFEYRQYVRTNGGAERMTFTNGPGSDACWTGQLDASETGRKDFRAEFLVNGRVVATASTHAFVSP